MSSEVPLKLWIEMLGFFSICIVLLICLCFIKYMHSYFLKDVASKPEFSHVNSLLFVDNSVEWECFSNEKKKSSIKLTWKMS